MVPAPIVGSIFAPLGQGRQSFNGIEQVASGAAAIDYIGDLFAGRGASTYGREAVSTTDHMLQAAHLAEESGAPPPLIAAALLHDIGHLLHEQGPNAAARGVDARHEQIGADWLARLFPEDVTEPIRRHVAAKRYLCAVEPDYLSALSPASVRSLNLQGGPMGAEQADRFINAPHGAAAVALRRWDDGAKVPGAPTPGFDHFRPLLLSLCRPGASLPPDD